MVPSGTLSNDSHFQVACGKYAFDLCVWHTFHFFGCGCVFDQNSGEVVINLSMHLFGLEGFGSALVVAAGVMASVLMKSCSFTSSSSLFFAVEE